MALNELIAQLQQNAAASEMRRAAAQQQVAKMAASAATPTMPTGGGGGDKKAPIIGGSSSSDNSPGIKLGPGQNIPMTKGINPYAGMKTLNFQGHSYTVNSTAAKRFQGFLKALAKTGYDIDSIGGYANRNIAGTSTKSLHSYGLAIDINPGLNPVTWNGTNKTNLPKGVGRLARRYGLTWGGNWNGSKRDPMHFSVPWFGTK